MSFTLTIKDETLVEQLARLKGVPVAKVVRNAGRDFAFAAQRATPLAETGRAQYWRFSYQGRTWYAPVAAVRHKSARRRWGDSARKVRISRGWGRATWIGVFRDLGIPPKPAPASCRKAATKSAAQTSGSGLMSEVRITDVMPGYDRFGRGTGGRHDAIADAGFAAAWAQMQKAAMGELEKIWNS